MPVLPVPEVTDPVGHAWVPEVTDDVIRRAKIEFAVDIPALTRRGPYLFFKALTRDPLKLGGLLWLAIERQAASQAVSPEAFGTLLAEPSGGFLDRLTSAFAAALANRYPLSRFGVAVHLGGFVLAK